MAGSLGKEHEAKAFQQLLSTSIQWSRILKNGEHNFSLLSLCSVDFFLLGCGRALEKKKHYGSCTFSSLF